MGPPKPWKGFKEENVWKTRIANSVAEPTVLILMWVMKGSQSLLQVDLLKALWTAEIAWSLSIKTWQDKLSVISVKPKWSTVPWGIVVLVLERELGLGFESGLGRDLVYDLEWNLEKY